MRIYRYQPIENSYVYAHMNPTKSIAVHANPKSTFAATLGLSHVPMYVGKGTGNRWSKLNRNESHKKLRSSFLNVGKDLIPFIIKDNLTECEALCLESKLIDIFGLIPFGGILTNLDEGVRSTERREKYKLDYNMMNTRNATWSN